MEVQNKKENGSAPGASTDLLERTTGTFGKYQLLLCLLIFITKLFIGAHQMAIIFLAPKVVYTCPGSNTTNDCPCPNPVYDKSLFTRSIIMEWGLICEKGFMVSFTQTMFQLGTLIGSILFGMASDRFGRKRPLLVAISLQIVLGIGAAFVPDYWTFTVARFFVGAAAGGMMVIGFVIILEFVGPKHRATLSAIYQVPFNMGHMMLPLFGYFFRDYKDFQIAISAPALSMLIYFCLITETPRWLLTQKRTDEAVYIITRMAKMNKLPTENIQADVQAHQVEMAKTPVKRGNLSDIFRTPNLRRNILIMSFNWMTCGYVFYGVSQYVGQLSGDVFINVSSSAIVTLMGTLLSIPLMKIMGRKTMLIVFNLICASCLFILTFTPAGFLSISMACIGVVCSFIPFVIVYLYCGELFPTIVRNAALGFCSMLARVGSMIAPFIVDLQKVAKWLPPIVFAVVPLMAAILTIFLPETKGCKLMDTLAEGEAFTGSPPKMKQTSEDRPDTSDKSDTVSKMPQNEPSNP